MGGLIGNPLGEKGSILNGADADNYTQSGIYGVNASNGKTTNFPEVAPLGTLVVFKSPKDSANGGSPIVQIMFDYNVGYVSIRIRWVGTWKSWRKLQFI